MLLRLDKFLASQGGMTRKEAARALREGRAAVNGLPASDGAVKIDPERDEISLNGRPLTYRRQVVLMMNKPAGTLSATEDRRQPTVLDLLPPEWRRRGLFPAGRLDRDSTGLLLLTDDGDLAHRMLSPKSHVWKRYELLLRRPATAEDAARFREGIEQGGDRFAPAEMYPGEAAGDGPFPAAVELREGKFHQVKRMFMAVGNEVLALRRTRIGGLALDENLEEGAFRLLSPEEIDLIFRQSE